jgi:hypothetical protein
LPDFFFFGTYSSSWTGYASLTSSYGSVTLPFLPFEPFFPFFDFLASSSAYFSATFLASSSSLSLSSSSSCCCFNLSASSIALALLSSKDL